MRVESFMTLTGIMYRASIKQKGVATSYTCKNRMKAIIMCWQNYMFYAYK